MLSNEPVTKIDLRFSDPNAVATGWDETRRVLETAELFWISTVRADGRPHVPAHVDSPFKKAADQDTCLCRDASPPPDTLARDQSTLPRNYDPL
jgi:hypothetical protein